MLRVGRERAAPVWSARSDRCYVAGRSMRSVLAGLLSSALIACNTTGTVGDAGVAAAGSDGTAPGASELPEDATVGGETDAGIFVGGGGSCPARADAAVCPAIPSIVAPPSPPPNAPALPAFGSWVGCQYSSCSSPSACTSCTCIADDAGAAAWDCNDAGWQVEGDAQPTPYCALNAGPVDAGGQPNVGPIEQCTEQYPICSGPYPESPGWQCCRIATLGGTTEISCMPNDAAAYVRHFGP